MLSKTSRQIALFHIFFYSKVIETVDIESVINVNNKTIIRDIKELQDAGLLKVKFSRKENGYIHIDDKKRCPFSGPVFSDNKAKNRHLKKLIRLTKIMIGLKGHIEYPYWGNNYSKTEESCTEWYKDKFPDVSRRTMQRDFKELKEIDYSIDYNREEKYYTIDFPEGIEALEYRLKSKYGSR